jgi:hypothetical protein
MKSNISANSNPSSKHLKAVNSKIKLSSSGLLLVLYPGKGECADPVNEDAILEKEGGGEPQDRNGERQLASDTGGGKT